MKAARVAIRPGGGALAPAWADSDTGPQGCLNQPLCPDSAVGVPHAPEKKQVTMKKKMLTAGALLASTGAALADGADPLAQASTAITGMVTAVGAILLIAFAIPVAVKSFRMGKRVLGAV